MPENSLLEPLEGYKSEFKDKHHQNTVDFFDELTKKGKVDVEANKKTVAEYRAKLEEIKNISGEISKTRTLKGFLTFLGVAFFIVAAIILLFTLNGGSLPLWAAILIVVAAVAFLIVDFAVFIKKLNAKLKDQNAFKEKLEGEAAAILDRAWEQMAGLNALYDWGMSAELVCKTVPIIKTDKNFDEKKFVYLHEKYGLSENTALNRSTQFCLSGSILGNPFLLCRDYEQNWEQRRYEGSLTIHWTETIHTNNGTRTVTRSQTLHAYVTKPAPVYSNDTYLVYGNEAAPNLIFSRKPSGMSGKTDKQIEKFVASQSKKLEKKARKAVTGNGTYTKLGNDEFEALFGGTDRNNEVEFRLLFTPLAQRNIVKLIKDPVPYGDDFTLQKAKQLNFVRSGHSQGFSYDADPARFVGYDYEKARADFVNYNDAYFKNLYFDFAPLLSVPLYQQHKSREFIYDREYKSNVSCYEHEVMANALDKDLLKPSGAITPSILKTNLVHKEGHADSVAVTAHAFEGKRRVTYVSVLGGDGRYHNVPVYWIEYLPVERKSSMAVEVKDGTRGGFNAIKGNKAFTDVMSQLSAKSCAYQRGLFAFLFAEALTPSVLERVDGVYPDSFVAETTSSASELARQMKSELLNIQNSASAQRAVADAAEILLKDESQETVEVAYVEEAPEPAATDADEDGEDGEDGEE